MRCRTQTPQGKLSAQTRAMEHERSDTASHCETNREEGVKRTVLLDLNSYLECAGLHQKPVQSELEF